MVIILIIAHAIPILTTDLASAQRLRATQSRIKVSNKVSVAPVKQNSMHLVLVCCTLDRLPAINGFTIWIPNQAIACMRIHQQPCSHHRSSSHFLPYLTLTLLYPTLSFSGLNQACVRIAKVYNPSFLFLFLSFFFVSAAF